MRMSTTLQSPPAAKAAVPAWRRWFPVVVLALGGVALGLIWGLPEGDTPRVYRTLATIAAVGATVVLLLGWVIFLAPFWGAGLRESRGKVPASVDLSGQGPNDWPQFRGNPQRDGVVRGGPALATDWTANPPRAVWGE